MIRKFIESDIEYLDKNDMLAYLEISYHKDVIGDFIFSHTDSNNTLDGVLYFKRHYTWYSENADLNRICPQISTQNDETFAELLEYAKKWLCFHSDDFTDKKPCLAFWENSSGTARLQKFMRCGFMEYSVCPCLKFKLNDSLKIYPVPKNMRIDELTYDPESVAEFIGATGEANNGVHDSEAELWFMSGESSHKVFMLKDGDKIVSSAAIWRITDERAAIENIFTSPEYRRKNMARVIITNTLEVLRRQGYKLATLSMRGRNLKAMRLYQSLGAELYFNQIELIFPLGTADYE